MHIDKLQEIYDLANEALKGRKKLEQLHNQYRIKERSHALTRSQISSYHIKCSDIMENIVSPAERDLKQFLRNL
jgi:hypothetical protein